MVRLSDAPPAIAPPSRAGRTPMRARVVRWGGRALVLALVALNAWYFWADRPAPAMKAIDAAIAGGRLYDAERDLRARLRSSPADGDARIKLARILVKRGDQLGCARELHQVAGWWPAKAEASFLEGQAFKQVDRARDAEAAWQVCIADDPLHPVPGVLLHGAAKELVVLYILESRMDDVRRTIWRAYDAATPAERPGVLVMRMRAELERIAHEESVVKLRRFVAADPEDWEARRSLAVEEQAIGDATAADAALTACLRARPSDPSLLRTRLEILNGRGDVDAIRAVIGRLPPEADGDARIWMYRGIVRQWDEDHAGAFEAFSRSARLDPNDPEALYKLGMAEKQLGREAEAQEHLGQSRQLYQAFELLKVAYNEYAEQSRRLRRDPAGYRAAVEGLATLCRKLGWEREATAWRKEIDEG